MLSTLEYSAISHGEFSLISRYLSNIDSSRVNFVELTGYKDGTHLKLVSPSGTIYTNSVSVFSMLMQTFSLPMNFAAVQKLLRAKMVLKRKKVIIEESR